MSILGLPRRSVPSPATHDQVVLNDLNSPMYLILALLRKHFRVLAAPLTIITGGSRASSSNLPSRPVCFELTDRSDPPTSPGETPRSLADSPRDRLWVGEEEEDDLPRRRPLPPRLPPRDPLDPRAPLVVELSARARCDRCVVQEEEVEGDLDRRLGDLPPPLLQVVGDLPLDRDLLVRARVLVSDVDRDLVVDRVVLVLDLDRDRDRDRDRCRDLDRFCCVCDLLDLLEALRPYLLPLVSVCCGCFDVVSCLDVESTAVVEVVGVAEVVFVSACPPGDPGGVELVTGANTVSLLTFTSHSPVVPYLFASSANST